MSETIFRRVTAADYPAIVALQTENLVANLSAEQKKDGYLSVLWTPEQIAGAAHDLAVIVALRGGDLAGYMVGTQRAYNERIPIVSHMMGLYSAIDYKGKPLAARRSFVYGPACVARKHRGKGVLEGLFSALLHEAAGLYDTGVAFIGADNERSIQAHTRKLGMERCSDFAFNGRDFQIFAFSVPG